MTFMINFIVPGDPVAKGRPRFRRIGKFVSTYSPKKTITYEKQISNAALLAMGDQKPLETPLSLYLYISMPIPCSYSKKRKADCLIGAEQHTKRPDIDNVYKLVGDALNGIVYKDDSQIVNLHVRKLYASTPQVEILVSEHLP